MAAAKEAEEAGRKLRAELRTAEAAAKAARATAEQEAAAAAAAQLALQAAEAEAEAKLERALQEAATQARSQLVQEKSRAQAESKKAVARAERDAEARLVAQRDEFAKHERTLRERIVGLQNAATEAREKGRRLGAPAADDASDGAAAAAVPSSARSVMSVESVASQQGSPGAPPARHATPGRRGTTRKPSSSAAGADQTDALRAAEARAEAASRAASASAEALRAEKDVAAAAAAASSSTRDATVAVMAREVCPPSPCRPASIHPARTLWPSDRAARASAHTRRAARRRSTHTYARAVTHAAQACHTVQAHARGRPGAAKPSPQPSFPWLADELMRAHSTLAPSAHAMLARCTPPPHAMLWLAGPQHSAPPPLHPACMLWPSNRAARASAHTRRVAQLPSTHARARTRGRPGAAKPSPQPSFPWLADELMRAHSTLAPSAHAMLARCTPPPHAKLWLAGPHALPSPRPLANLWRATRAGAPTATLG